MARKRFVPITSEHYFDWALDEFDELVERYGVRKATRIFNEDCGEYL